MQSSGGVTLPGTGGHQPVIYTIQPQPTGIKYNQSASIILGVMGIIAGLLSTAVGVVSIVFGANVTEVGTGVWCGLPFFVLTGSFGIVAGKRKTKCWIVTYMVMSIITCSVMCLNLLVMASIGLANDTAAFKAGCYYDSGHQCRRQRVKVAMNSVLVFVSVFEAVVCIVASAFCCKAACCCATKPVSQNVVIPGHHVSGLQVSGQQVSGQQVVPIPGTQNTFLVISNPHNYAVNAATLGQAMNIQAVPNMPTNAVASNVHPNSSPPPKYSTN